MTFQWSVASIDKLRAMCAQGHTASEIGSELGVSRCSVIGKRRRLGLCVSREVAASRAAQFRWANKSPPKTFSINSKKGYGGKEKKGINPFPAPPTNPVTLLDLEGCKWPLNNGGPFLFCNAKTTGRYCDHHAWESCL